MKALVGYDSLYSNAEKIARAIGNTLASHADVSILSVSDAKPQHVAKV